MIQHTKGITVLVLCTLGCGMLPQDTSMQDISCIVQFVEQRYNAHIAISHMAYEQKTKLAAPATVKHYFMDCVTNTDTMPHTALHAQVLAGLPDPKALNLTMLEIRAVSITEVGPWEPAVDKSAIQQIIHAQCHIRPGLTLKEHIQDSGHTGVYDHCRDRLHSPVIDQHFSRGME